ncbi:MAG: ABC transporter substrate-binding protein [Holosporales bacterium]|nr:ABC transporter substrate-binding protein [Holosporales bacterium]
MKNFLVRIFLVLFSFVFFCAKGLTTEAPIQVATCADYPPFEFSTGGEIVGFDIDIAQLVAKKLNRKIVFVNMPFPAIISALQTGSVDMGISTIAATPERRKNIDFSLPYYIERLAVLYKKCGDVTEEQLKGKRVACQMGTTMQEWVKTHAPNAELILMDNNNQVVEAVHSGQVEFGVMDAYQAKAFCDKTGLKWNEIARSDAGYAIAFKKESPLMEIINAVLAELKDEGEIQKLEEKWSLR